jgi:hypothetical protein
MRKMIFTIIIALLFISCKEDEIVEPALFTISGTVENENGDKISTKVFLISDDTLSSISSSDGSFIFENIPKDEYSIFIDDQNYAIYDTIFTLLNNLSINIVLEPANYLDYFPLTIGNWWTYTYDYRPHSSDIFIDRQQGNLTWEIIANENDSIYIIEETIDGIIMNWDLNYDVDTTKVSMQRTIKFIFEQNGFITIPDNNHFNNILHIKFNRYCREELSPLILEKDYFSWGEANDNLIILNSYDCGYHLKLNEKIGIIELNIHNWSNGSPIGSFILSEYEIKE